MPRIRSKQVWLSLLVAALFSPVVLSTGSAALRPAWLGGSIAGLPVFSVLVAGLLVLFVVLVWVFSAFAFGETDEGGDRL
jgi:hypothetical protein